MEVKINPITKMKFNFKNQNQEQKPKLKNKKENENKDFKSILEKEIENGNLD